LMIGGCVCVVLISHMAVFAQLSRPETESDALTAIKTATNPTLKLTAAEDFVARFPASRSRSNIAELIAGEISRVRDGAVALALLERALAVFTSEQEREIFKRVSFEVYAISNQYEAAFSLAAELLAKNPQDVHVLMLMASIAVSEWVKPKRELAELGLRYTLQAIAIVEAGRQPAAVKDERWATYKNDLGLLYRNSAILYMSFNNVPEARTRATKATMLMPNEPSNFAMLGRAIGQDYLTQLEKYDAMADGEAKQGARRKLDLVLDDLIDAFAHAVGLSVGRPRYQDLVQIVVPLLTNYYKTRHQSTEGLQQLIDRYRR